MKTNSDFIHYEEKERKYLKFRITYRVLLRIKNKKSTNKKINID